MKYPESAKRLSEILTDLNMKAQELADKSGVSKASISQYLNGSHCPSNLSSGKLAEVLNVNPLYLMGFNVSKIKSEEVEKAEKDFDFYNKFSMLSERDRKIIIELMNSMLSSKESGG